MLPRVPAPLQFDNRQKGATVSGRSRYSPHRPAPPSAIVSGSAPHCALVELRLSYFYQKRPAPSLSLSHPTLSSADKGNSHLACGVDDGDCRRRPCKGVASEEATPPPTDSAPPPLRWRTGDGSPQAPPLLPA